MDDLDYDYAGDQLINVTDEETGSYPHDFTDGNLHPITTLNDYLYDSNGNLSRDLNKGINNISYNHLNLPLQVTKDATHKVEYVYAANGSKLQKTVTDGSTVTVTDYAAIGNYTGGDLDFIFTGEGRAVDDNGTWRYEYYYKDHLGNTRLGFSDYDYDEEVDVTEITQQQNYYPFGLEHKGTDYGVATQTTHKYLFNGKELQNELNLNWTAMDFRNLDNEIGRFFSIDPLASDFPSWTSYHYVHNNPIKLIDPTGMSAETYEIDVDGNTQKVDNTKYYKEEDGTVTSVAEGKTYEGSGTEVDKVQSKSDSDKHIYTSKSTMQSKKSIQVSGLSAKTDMYSITDEGEAKSFFEFAAQVSDVEWDNTNYNTGDETNNLVTTSHESNKSVGLGLLDAGGAVINYSDHSHPGNSGTHAGDSKVIGRLSSVSRNASFRVFLPHSGKYLNYNQFSHR